MAIWRRSSRSPWSASTPRPGSCGRQLVHQRADAAHLLHLLELALQIRQVEALARDHLAGQPLGLVEIDFALDLLDQRHHIAHAEDA